MENSSKLKRCERCGKHKYSLYNMNNMWICSDCVRGIAFYKVFKEGFRDSELRGDVIIVGIDIGNTVWFNPFAQAWLYPLLLWTFFKTRNMTFYFEDLRAMWKYRTPLEEVLKLYQEEEIFKIMESDGKNIGSSPLSIG